MDNLFEKLLKDFGENVGIPGLALDDSGCCCLSFDDLLVNVEYNDQTRQFFLSAHIGDLPAEGREALYERLLSANYFFRDTQGATLAIDKPSNRVLLVFQAPASALDATIFSNTVRNFIQTTEQWRDRVARAASPELPSAIAPDTGSAAQFIQTRA